MRFIISKYLNYFLLLCCFLLPVQSAWAAVSPDDAPDGSESGVIESRITQEAKDTIRETEIPVAISFEDEGMPKEMKDEIAILVRRIRVEPYGNIPKEEFESYLDTASLRPVLEPFEGRENTASELLALKEKIEWVYRTQGFFAVARLPPQDVKGGEVVIEILLARMGEVSLDGAKYFRGKKTLSYWQIERDEIIKYDDIRSQIYAMNENPDRTVKPLLKAGEKPGTTDIILKTEETFPLHPRFSFDNYGIKLTGKRRPGFMLRHNNLLTLDDLFIIGTVYGRSFGALYLQHKIPLNTKGTSVNYGFTHAQVAPKKEFKNFGINGLSQSYSLSLHQTLFQTDRSRGNAHLGIDFKEKRTRILAVTTSWDKLKVLNLGFEANAKDGLGISSASHDFYLGLPSRGTGHPLASRGGSHQFFKYEFSAARRNRFLFSTELVARIQGQLSPDRLLPQEQIFMGGGNTVRGYPESDYGADQGMITNFELKGPFWFIPGDWQLPFEERTLRQQLTWIAFLDHGYGRLNDPRANERGTRNLLGAGGGVRVRFRDMVTFGIEWGIRFGDTPVTESGREQVHFKFSTEL